MNKRDKPAGTRSLFSNLAAAIGLHICIAALLVAAMPKPLLAVEALPSYVSPADLNDLGADVGIGVLDKRNGRQSYLNGKDRFPMQSVYKLPIAIATMKLVDDGRMSLTEKIKVRREDIDTTYSPLGQQIKGAAAEFTLRQLIEWAVQQSDNTATDRIIAKAGGPAVLNDTLSALGIENVRIDRPERVLQPESLNKDQYFADPRDTATPEGMIAMLDKLQSGRMLSKNSTDFLMQTLYGCRTGSKRIKAGLPDGWSIAHKTGTGRDVQGVNLATNDVAICRSPAGDYVLIAIFIKGSKAPLVDREAFMAKVARAVVAAP